MGERAQKVVIRDGTVVLYQTRWGGQRCAEVLAEGESGLHEDLEISESMNRMWEPDFAEGGYLVDFDRQHILIHSWDQTFLEEIRSPIASTWAGWSVRIAPEGVPDFYAYLATLGLTAGDPDD